MVEKDKIIDVLKQCFDPEIPVDLWSLGLIYDISITKRDNNKSDVNITMTLTTPGCSMGSYMAEDIKMKLSGIDEINSSEVNITFDPPWKPHMMNDQAREKLGFPVEERPEGKGKEREWE
jgi:metal-sulfur cluster biosynthetic enzyme